VLSRCQSVYLVVARVNGHFPTLACVLKKYFKSSDDSLMGAAYDFYAREVVQQPPSCSAAQFAEAQNVLGATLPAVRAYQLDKLYDNSYVKSAVDRGLAKA
jgi:hypothetical protein